VADGHDCSPRGGSFCDVTSGRRAIVLTFDNLGEASALERGTWPDDEPIGRHPSVTVALPHLLEELAALSLRATFFVEAINCELNPEAVAAIAAAGHELGIHGWRHERWGDLDPGRERELLTRSRDAYARLGIAPVAFRPPGGDVHPDTARHVQEVGCRWLSPHGTRFGVDDDGLGWVPFQWELVDAYLRMDSFAQLRLAHGDPAAPLPAMTAGQRLAGGLTEARGPRTLVLHPFLLADEAWWQQGLRLLRWLARWRDAGEVAVVTGSELVAQLGG
jgi:peptidoglycan/xylan/chitin deacetylase (PgdA/CDA1 family)